MVLKEKCRNSGAGAAQSVPLAVRAPRSVARSCRVPCGLGSEPGDGGGGEIRAQRAAGPPPAASLPRSSGTVRCGRQVGFGRRGKRNGARGAGLEQPAVAVGSCRRVIPEGDLRDPLTRGVLWSAAVGALPEAGGVIGLCGSPAAQLRGMGRVSRLRRCRERRGCAGSAGSHVQRGGKGRARRGRRWSVSARLGTALRSRRPGTARRLRAAPRVSALRASPHLPPGALGQPGAATMWTSGCGALRSSSYSGFEPSIGRVRKMMMFVLLLLRICAAMMREVPFKLQELNLVSYSVGFLKGNSCCSEFGPWG